MAGKNSKQRKQTNNEEAAVSRKQRLAQLLFAVFAVLLILSMVLSAVATY